MDTYRLAMLLGRSTRINETSTTTSPKTVSWQKSRLLAISRIHVTVTYRIGSVHTVCPGRLLPMLPFFFPPLGNAGRRPRLDTEEARSPCQSFPREDEEEVMIFESAKPTVPIHHPFPRYEVFVQVVVCVCVIVCVCVTRIQADCVHTSLLTRSLSCISSFALFPDKQALLPVSLCPSVSPCHISHQRG